MALDVPSQLSQYKFPLTVVLAGIFTLSLVLYMAPRLVDVFAYFGPLFVSTAVLVVAVVAFTSISGVPNEPHGEKAGEGMLEYVAGPPGFGEGPW
ncbi:hypothetical protein MLD38_009948 [Melastoma candidum]|uniref:Uncharacterized protein n=1 Tax=Melastoma candidum TaxID=119954 RepID=A0ACB9QYB9_9MYRT|nr:hypothetical protein MLD38_009948 [Melastoma candidum]